MRGYAYLLCGRIFIVARSGQQPAATATRQGPCSALLFASIRRVIANRKPATCGQRCPRSCEWYLHCREFGRGNSWPVPAKAHRHALSFPLSLLDVLRGKLVANREDARDGMANRDCTYKHESRPQMGTMPLSENNFSYTAFDPA